MAWGSAGIVSSKAQAGWRALLSSLAALSCAFWPGPCSAEVASVPGLSAPVDVHGFVSQGFILSAENEYLAKSKSGSFEFSEAALNFTNQVSNSLRVGFQLLAYDMGPIGNYNPSFDWFYVDYRVRDWLGIRIGRLKMPFGLYNETNDVDVARVPILLPQSIYQTDHRQYLFAQSGGELYGNVGLGDAGALEYRFYGGGLSPDIPSPPPPGITVSDASFPYVYGARGLWFTPLDGLTAGVSGQVLRLDSNVLIDPAVFAFFQAQMLVPQDITNAFAVQFHVSRWVASLNYAAHDWDISAEYSRWTGQFESPTPVLFPIEVVNERYYVMASHRVSSWFTPGLYYSGYFVDESNRSGHWRYQHDVAFTTRYDLNEHWLLKLEWHLMRGTAALDNRSLNDGLPQESLAPFWGAFFAKSTAYF